MGQTIIETIGVDLGDQYSVYCTVDQASGEVQQTGRLATNPAAFEAFFKEHPGARVVMEVGTHSPWASRIAAAQCAEIYVANARELHFIFKNKRKSDVVDAEALARVGRLDPQLLHPAFSGSSVPTTARYAKGTASARIEASTSDVVPARRGGLDTASLSHSEWDARPKERGTRHSRIPRRTERPSCPPKCSSGFSTRQFESAGRGAVVGAARRTAVSL